jgi:hypothetical protein
MQDGTLLLIAGVGLALVCIGVFVVGLIMLLRIIGVGTPLWTALLGGGDDEHRRIVRASTKPDLRSIAQGASSDFDAALARHDAQTQTAPLSTNPPLTGSPDALPPAPPRLGSRRTPSRPNIDEHDDDDLLGAVLDDNEL